MTDTKAREYCKARSYCKKITMIREHDTSDLWLMCYHNLFDNDMNRRWAELAHHSQLFNWIVFEEHTACWCFDAILNIHEADLSSVWWCCNECCLLFKNMRRTELLLIFQKKMSLEEDNEHSTCKVKCIKLSTYHVADNFSIFLCVFSSYTSQ